MKKTIAMTILAVVFNCCHVIPVGAQFSTNAPTVALRPPPDEPATVQGGIKQIGEAIFGDYSNWFGEVHFLYADKLQQHLGGGVGLFYQVNRYLYAGTRFDWVNGGFWMPSGNATLQVPFHWKFITVTPFGYAGVGVPLGGATIGNVTLPGKAVDNNGEPTAILGYGGALMLWANKVNTWKIALVADREQWSGFPGNQYRGGALVQHTF